MGARGSPTGHRLGAYGAIALIRVSEVLDQGPRAAAAPVLSAARRMVGHRVEW